MSDRIDSLDVDAIIAWLYVMETLDTCIDSRMDSAFMQLLFDLRTAYADEWYAVVSVRTACRLVEVNHDVY